MSQISQILDYIKSINERLNLWASNAKKVEELPAIETLNPEALLMVSDDGTSKKLEIQQIIDAVSLASQNNTIREVLLGEITEFIDLNYLFNNNGIIVSESEIVMLQVLETKNSRKIKRQFLWKLGKGTFNPIGSTNLNTKVLELQSKFIDEVLAEDLTDAPDAVVYDLGVITDPILEVINTAIPSLNYEDEEKIYYIRATKDDVNYLYNFIGVNGIYGNANLQMVGSDLVLVYSSNTLSENYVDLISPQTIEGPKTFTEEVTAPSFSGSGENLTDLKSENTIYVNGSLTNVKEALDQLLYVFPDITNFTISPSVVEIGTTVSSATLNWNLNKALTTLSIDNGVGSITPSLLSKALTGLSLVTNTTYTITGGDGTNTDTASTTLNFRSKRWWGTSALATLTSADILTLQNSELATNRQQTRTINGGGDYIWFAFPTSFGLPTFVVNGLPSTAFTTSTVSHTNASGNTQDYYVIRTTTVQNGTLNIQLL